MKNSQITVTFEDEGITNTVERILELVHDNEELGQHTTKTSLSIIEVFGAKSMNSIVS